MLTPVQQSFLSSVDQFNEQYSVVCAGDLEISLQHPFWSEVEITQSGQVQDDWGLQTHFVPFYGDWHTIICLDLRDGSVRLLDDNRDSVFRWPSVDCFVKSLKLKAETPTDTSGIIENQSWLDF